MHLRPQHLVATLALVAGCASDLQTSTDALPIVTGSYVGHYRVPTVPELAAAASFQVDHVDWTVVDGIATLHYDLPDGLVGGKLSIKLAGPISTNSPQATLSSEQGMGTCVAAGTTITCREEFADLGVLPISAALVEQVAAQQYTGPAADRLAVAGVFSSDPIGFVDFDLEAPVVDDHGGGNGGRGSGGGSGSN